MREEDEEKSFNVGIFGIFKEFQEKSFNSLNSLILADDRINVKHSVQVILDCFIAMIAGNHS